MVVSITSSSFAHFSEMNANNTYRQRSNTTGDLPSVFDDDDQDSSPAPPVFSDWGCGRYDEHQQIFSRSWSSSTGSTESWTDDSLSLSDNIEDKHFAKALDQGVFDSVHEKNRKDRRKSFEKDHYHHHHHHHHHHRSSKKHLDLNDDNNNHHHHHHNRPRSKSIDVRIPPSTAADMMNNKNINDSSTNKHVSSNNNSKRMSKRKLRQELCNSGINLNDAATEELSIDEIYEMQNRFFSSLKLTSDYIRQCSSDECGGGYMDMPSSPVRKNRSVSFH